MAQPLGIFDVDLLHTGWFDSSSADGLSALGWFDEDLVAQLGIVWPSPSVVLSGVMYGPTGVEYVGTYVCPTGGASRPVFVFDD